MSGGNGATPPPAPPADIADASESSIDPAVGQQRVWAQGVLPVELDHMQANNQPTTSQQGRFVGSCLMPHLHQQLLQRWLLEGRALKALEKSDHYVHKAYDKTAEALSTADASESPIDTAVGQQCSWAQGVLPVELDHMQANNQPAGEACSHY